MEANRVSKKEPWYKTAKEWQCSECGAINPMGQDYCSECACSLECFEDEALDEEMLDSSVQKDGEK